MRVHPRLGFVGTGGGRLAYHVIGDGGTGWVVWPQWINGHLDLMWTDPTIEAIVTDLLRDGLSSIFLQSRGTGLSDPTARPPTVGEQMSDLLAVMDAESVPQATIVPIGVWSLPAMLFAAQHPDRVHGLVIWGSPLTGPAVDQSAHGWTPQSARSCIQTWQRAAEEWGSGESLRAWSAGVFSPYNARLMGTAERCSVSRDLARLHIEALFSFDARAVASQVCVPTRVLGLPDNAFAIAAMEALADAIPGSEFQVITASRPGDSFGDAYRPVVRHVAEVARGADTRYGELENVFATVLFTDIVDSTRALAAVGDAKWSQTLSDYYRMVRREMAALGGRVVDTTGDGTLCELPTPATAIDAALLICDRGRALGVETRAGVHTGQCRRLGDDLTGITVHIGARIGALAGPGEVLVSQTVRDLAENANVIFVSRGESELKGLDGRYQLSLVSRNPDEDESVAVVPQPNRADRAVLQLARHSPVALRRLNQLGSRMQRQLLMARRNRSAAD